MEALVTLCAERFWSSKLQPKNEGNKKSGKRLKFVSSICVFEPRFDLEVQQQAAQQICEEGLRYDLESLHCRHCGCHVGCGTFVHEVESWQLRRFSMKQPS